MLLVPLEDFIYFFTLLRLSRAQRALDRKTIATKLSGIKAIQLWIICLLLFSKLKRETLQIKIIAQMPPMLELEPLVGGIQRSASTHPHRSVPHGGQASSRGCFVIW